MEGPRLSDDLYLLTRVDLCLDQRSEPFALLDSFGLVMEWKFASLVNQSALEDDVWGQIEMLKRQAIDGRVEIFQNEPLGRDLSHN